MKTPQKRKQPQSEMSAVEAKAIHFLTRREHGFDELKQKLCRTFDCTKSIESVLLALKSNNLQSDERFVESYTRHRCHLGYGPKRIQCELVQKGINVTVIEEVINLIDFDWIEKGKETLQKKWASPSLKQRMFASQMQYKCLNDRGYLSHQIEKILSSIEW